MPERQQRTSWVRFTWRLEGLDLKLHPPQAYGFRSAVPDELDAITQVVLSAYAPDPNWKAELVGIERRMRERIQSTLGAPDSDYLLAELQGAIAAVSGVAKSHWTDQNFLTGICVHPKHQRKGLGRYLLGLSLLRLREMGVQRPIVYTKAGSLADRKIYPLYGSIREEDVVYPALQSQQEGK